MPRNTETTRQWETLRDLDAARVGLSIARLAELRGVHQKTIRRDVEALSRAGFPLYEDKVNGTTLWKLQARPFRALEDTGLSLTELCALYFSRALIVSLTGSPLEHDVERVLAKVERALPAAAKAFLDRIPLLLSARATGRKCHDDRRTREVMGRAIEASLRRRRVTMRYASASSARTKDYVVEPLRLTYADGGLYLTAHVPTYGETRTFAIERIETFAVGDERFEPRALPAELFGDSLGVHTGTPERVCVEFEPDAASFVRERRWHKTQKLQARVDGGVVLTMEVTVDRPLERWVLGFGPAARVLAPAHLAQRVFRALDEARSRYQPRLISEGATGASQRRLPLGWAG